VAIRKNRPVLYEVVRLSKRQRESAWKRRPPPPPPEPTSTIAPPRAPTTTPRGTYGAAPGVRVASRRIYLALGWPALAVAAVAVLFIGWVVFEAGTRAARRRAELPPPAPFVEKPNVPESAQPRTGETELVPEHRPTDGQRIATPPAPGEKRAEPEHATEPPAAPSPPAFEFKTGYDYVVVQHFSKSRLDVAVAAAKFLQARGVEAVIWRGDDLRVVAAEAFLLKQKDAKAAEAEKRRCEELKSKIRSLGKEFSKETGYAFEQCYSRILKPK